MQTLLRCLERNETETSTFPVLVSHHTSAFLLLASYFENDRRLALPHDLPKLEKKRKKSLIAKDVAIKRPTGRKWANNPFESISGSKFCSRSDQQEKGGRM